MDVAFLAWLRAFLNVSQGRLAARIGISTSLIQKIEAGDRSLSREREREILKALNVSDEDIAKYRQLYNTIQAMKTADNSN